MYEGPGEHDSHLMDDDPSDTVACAKCGKQIWAHAQRCHHCGVHFRGEAWEFDRQDEARSKLWPWVVAAVVIAMLGWLLL